MRNKFSNRLFASLDMLTCGCLVIGSGPGGAVTASVLAEAGHDVLVVEEGEDQAGRFLPYSLDEMDNLCRYGGISVSWGNPKISYLEGCCLGGASEINADNQAMAGFQCVTPFLGVS
jgi:choline dehydrogenase-like flavoprotein